MSGRINLSNLSDSLKEHLNSLGLTEEQVNELIENALVEINEKDVEQDDIVNGLVDKVGELNGLMTEEKGNLVGAINELFQSANNGKELIANAIGEPLDSNDTFSAMSGDINSLLSTFKTNMMNNGVTVESGDKFKSLIDKIATMVEEGSGKGIQFVEGKITNIDELLTKTCTAVMFSGNTYTQGGDYKCFSLENLGFKPSIVVVYSVINNGNTYVHGVYNDFCGKDYCESGWGWDQWNNRYNYYSYRYMDFMKTEPLAIPIYHINTTISSIDITYYAIGVGEEDTTLRDSLASILTEEGVSVTEEDDMASLISKVDTEFNDKENEISNIKQDLVDALANKGIDADVGDSFDNLINNIGDIGGQIITITQTELKTSYSKSWVKHTINTGLNAIPKAIIVNGVGYLYIPNSTYTTYPNKNLTIANSLLNYSESTAMEFKYFYKSSNPSALLQNNNSVKFYITDITENSFSFYMAALYNGSGTDNSSRNLYTNTLTIYLII